MLVKVLISIWAKTKPHRLFHCIASRESFTLGHSRLVNEQDSVINHQTQQDDEADHGKQIHRLEHDQVDQIERNDTADGGKWQGQYHQQAIEERAKQRAHQ